MRRTSNAQTHEQGFSLIELLIVVLIIATLSALALPNFFESKQAAHNASAMQSLRLIHTAEIAYRAAHAQYGDLATLGNAGFLTDPLLVSGQRSNYFYVITLSPTEPQNYYEATAAPGVAPWRFYFIDASGVIRTRIGAMADVSSPPINY